MNHPEHGGRWVKETIAPGDYRSGHIHGGDSLLTCSPPESIAKIDVRRTPRLRPPHPDLRSTRGSAKAGPWRSAERNRCMGVTGGCWQAGESPRTSVGLFPNSFHLSACLLEFRPKIVAHRIADRVAGLTSCGFVDYACNCENRLHQAFHRPVRDGSVLPFFYRAPSAFQMKRGTIRPVGGSCYSKP